MASRRVLVLGATGATGQHVVAQALRQGHVVTAFVRNPRGVTVGSDRLRVITGSVTEDDDTLSRAMRDHDVVISTLGRGASFTSAGFMARSMPRIIRAMEGAGVRRLVFMSAFGVGETFQDVPWLPRLFMRTLLRDIYRDKASAEEMLRASSLDWTLVYPTGLVNRPATGQWRVAARLSLRGFPSIARADVAAFLLTQIDDRAFVRRGALVSSTVPDESEAI